MKRYLQLYYYFFRNSLMRDLEFRFNVLIWTVMNFLFLGLMFVSVELIYGQVEAIAGWNKNEVLLLLCVNSLFYDFLWTLVLANLLGFSHLIRHGELDFVLLKPVNPRFFVSTRYFESDHYLRILILVFVISRLLKTLGVQLTIFSLLNFLSLFVLGIFIFYSFFFILTTSNFWFINVFNLEDLFSGIMHVGRFPVRIFKKGFYLFFTYVVPTAFIATFPTQALLGKGSLGMIGVALVIALFMFSASQLFWQFALRHYQSASS